MKPAEIFLSHASADRKFANRLAAALVRHRLKVFYSRKSLRGAQQWHDEIGRALARCNWFLLLLSPAAVRSEWVKRSIDKLSWTLSGFQQIDFRDRFDEGCRELLDLWNVSYRPTARPRPRP